MPSPAFLGGKAEHEAGDGFFGGVRKGRGREGAAVEDGEAVGEGEEFVEVGVDEEDGGAAGAGFEELPHDEGGGADVEAAGGVDGDDEGFLRQRVGVEFAGEDGFLLVAAGEAGGGVGCGAATDVERFDEAGGVGAPGGKAQEAAA